MSALLIKLAVLVIGGLIYGAIKRAAEAQPAPPPPLPVPRAPHRPRRRAAASPPPEQKGTSAPVAPVAASAPAQAATVAPRRQVRFRFSGSADLRRAFVASEVLGRPASLREPRI